MDHLHKKMPLSDERSQLSFQISSDIQIWKPWYTQKTFLEINVWVKIYFGIFCPCTILQTDILPNGIVEEMCACDNILAGGDIQRSWSTASDQ